MPWIIGAIVLFVLVSPVRSVAATPIPPWMPNSFPCPGRVIGVVDYKTRTAYILPLQRLVKVAVPRSERAWRTGCAIMGKPRKDQPWCPTPNMRARRPELGCAGPYSRDKANPTGAAFVPIDFINDPADRFLGFHGTNDEKVLGTMITSGCTRIDNATILAVVDGKLFRAGDFLYYQWRR